MLGVKGRGLDKHPFAENNRPHDSGELDLLLEQDLLSGNRIDGIEGFFYVVGRNSVDEAALISRIDRLRDERAVLVQIFEDDPGVSFIDGNGERRYGDPIAAGV